MFETVRGRGRRLFPVPRETRGSAHAVIRVDADVRGGRVVGRGLGVDECGRGAYGHGRCGRRGQQPVRRQFLRHGQRHGRETQTGPRPETQRHVAPGLGGRRAAAAAVQQSHGAGHHQRAAEPHAGLERVAQRIVLTPVDPSPRTMVARGPGAVVTPVADGRSRGGGVARR